MCHGRYDQILELALASDSLAALRNLGCAVEWHDYPMAHEVCADEIDDISAFLRLRLPAPQ
jgi:phospholipase/carboxylesterase